MHLVNAAGRGRRSVRPQKLLTNLPASIRFNPLENSMRRGLFFTLCLILLTLPACQRFRSGANLNSKEAVKAAIDAHLAKRRGQLALDQMNVEVKDVKFQDDRAEADVLFSSKTGTASMTMHYSLRREGDHWVVERSGSTSMGLPPGHPPAAEPASPAGPPPGEMPRQSH